MRSLCVVTCIFCFFACNTGRAQESAQQNGEATTQIEKEQISLKVPPLEQLKELRKQARTAAEKVALTDAWIKAQRDPLSARKTSLSSFSVRMTELRAKTASERPLGERVGLAWDARQGLIETLVQARSPKEAMVLTDEFLKINAETLRELIPNRPTLAERHARLLQIFTLESSKTEALSLNKEIALGLLEIRASTNNPARTVALIDEFLKLNAKTIAEAIPHKHVHAVKP